MDEARQERKLALLADASEDPESAPVDRAIVRYALKLTRTPAEVSREDVEELRAHGLDDRGIHDLCAIVAYYAFVNRIADGLGVELEGGEAG